MSDPYVIVGPDGLAYVGLHESEDDAWRVFMGWPTRSEVRHLQALGWYCARAELTWRRPTSAQPPTAPPL